MAIQTGDNHWLRVRAPLVALTDAELEALRLKVTAFGINTATD